MAPLIPPRDSTRPGDGPSSRGTELDARARTSRQGYTRRRAGSLRAAPRLIPKAACGPRRAPGPWLFTALVATAMLLALPASAEQRLLDGQFGLGTGLQGGSNGNGGMTWGLGRLRVVAGLEMRTDENHTQGVGILGYAEVLGGRGTLGAELRYQGWVEKWLAVHGGLMGNIAPESLFGGVVGAKLVLPMGDRFGLFVEPEFAAFPLGTDRPDNSVLMWFLLTGGVRASF